MSSNACLPFVFVLSRCSPNTICTTVDFLRCSAPGSTHGTPVVAALVYARCRLGELGHGAQTVAPKFRL